MFCRVFLPDYRTFLRQVFSFVISFIAYLLFIFVDHEIIYYARTLIDYEKLPLRDNARYGCFRCKKTYGLKKTLGRHLRLDCGQLPTFCCQVCPKKFKHGYILIKHMRNTHNMQIEKMRHRRQRTPEFYIDDDKVTRYPNIFEDLEEGDLIY